MQIRTESVVNDELHSRKIANFFHRLGLNVNLEEWSVVYDVKTSTFQYYKFGNKRYDTFELAVSTIYVQQCHANSVGGYLSDGYYYFEGQAVAPSEQKYIKFGLTMLSSIGVNDTVYQINDFVYYRWRDNKQTDSKYNIAVGKIMVLFKQAKSVTTASKKTKTGNLRSLEPKMKRKRPGREPYVNHEGESLKDHELEEVTNNNVAFDRTYDVAIILMELNHGGEFHHNSKQSLRIDEVVLPTDVDNRPKFFTINDCDLLARINVADKETRNREMGSMKETNVVLVDDEETKLQPKLRIPLFVENFKRSDTDGRPKYPRPYVRKGTGPKIFFSANALNRDYGTKLPDFVFYNQACNSTKKLIHTKHGYESVFHAANSYQTQISFR